MWAIGDGTRKVSPGETCQCPPIWRIRAWIELWVCRTPFGRPVVPDVYRIMRTVSAFNTGNTLVPSPPKSDSYGVCWPASPRTTTTSGGAAIAPVTRSSIVT
nr:hypothetical protein CPGR_05143 [Mycolicibacterium malmesburyense]